MKFYDKNGSVYRTRIAALISTIVRKPINPITIYNPGRQTIQSERNSEADIYDMIDDIEIADEVVIEPDASDVDEQVDEHVLHEATPRVITAQFDPDDPTLNSDDVVKKSVDTIAGLAEEAKHL